MTQLGMIVFMFSFVFFKIIYICSGWLKDVFVPQVFCVLCLVVLVFGTQHHISTKIIQLFLESINIVLLVYNFLHDSLGMVLLCCHTSSFAIIWWQNIDTVHKFSSFLFCDFIVCSRILTQFISLHRSFIMNDFFFRQLVFIIFILFEILRIFNNFDVHSYFSCDLLVLIALRITVCNE